MMECDHGVDPIWFTAMMRKQRARERDLIYKESMKQQFLTRNLDDIAEALGERGEVIEEVSAESSGDG